MDGPDNLLPLRTVPEAIRAQSLLLFEDGEWLIGVPLTPEAAAWWGAFTDWCTASDDSAFHLYHRRGPLVVFQHRTASWRWQLHASTREFRDMANRKASWVKFVGQVPQVADALARAFVRGLWG